MKVEGGNEWVVKNIEKVMIKLSDVGRYIWVLVCDNMEKEIKTTEQRSVVVTGHVVARDRFRC